MWNFIIQNIMTIAALLTIIALGIFGIRQRVQLIEALRISDLKEKRYEQIFNNLSAYQYLFLHGADFKGGLFSLNIIRKILTNLGENKMDVGSLNKNDSSKLKDFFLMLQGVMFQRFILNLPITGESLEKIINFDYKHLLSAFGSGDKTLERHVMKIWQAHVDELKDADGIKFAFDQVKDKQFFHGLSSIVRFPTSQELSNLGWVQILQKRADEIAEQDFQVVLKSANNHFNGSCFDLLAKSIQQLKDLIDRDLISQSQKLRMLVLAKPMIENTVSFFYKHIEAPSISQAEKYLETRKIYEFLYPSEEEEE